MKFVCLSIAALICIPGCAMHPVYVSQLNLSYSKPMVSTKARMPLYIVADPADVPDNIVNPQDVVKETEIHDLRTFVRRDLRNFFASYFDQVQVVESSSSLPQTPHALAVVRIASLKPEADITVGSSRAGMTQQGKIMAMIDWSVGIRRSSDKEFLLSYTDRVFGTYPLINVAQTPQMFGSALENALTNLAKKYADSGIHSRFLEAS